MTVNTARASVGACQETYAPQIMQRLDAAFERSAWRFPESKLRWIYLDEEDWRDFDSAMRAKWPSLAHCFAYRDIQIRSGKKSRLVTAQGCLVCIPKRLSQRTQAAA